MTALNSPPTRQCGPNVIPPLRLAPARTIEEWRKELEVEDALGNKKKSKDSYRGVLAYPDTFGYHAYVKHRLSHPYVKGASVGILSPL